MIDPKDRQDIAQLDKLNDQLTASIGRCRFLLNDCRSKLAANSNDKQAAGLADDDEIQQRTS